MSHLRCFSPASPRSVCSMYPDPSTDPHIWSPRCAPSALRLHSQSSSSEASHNPRPSHHNLYWHRTFSASQPPWKVWNRKPRSSREHRQQPAFLRSPHPVSRGIRSLLTVPPLPAPAQYNRTWSTGKSAHRRADRWYHPMPQWFLPDAWFSGKNLRLYMDLPEGTQQHHLPLPPFSTEDMRRKA